MNNREDRKIVRIDEGWSTFELDDGAVIKAKMMVTDVQLAGVDEKGLPKYEMQFQTVTRVVPGAKEVD